MSNPLLRIGQGFCGTVWAADHHGDFNYDGVDVALKREDGAPGRCLKIEWEHLQLINSTSRQYHTLLSQISIPQSVSYLLVSDSAWPDVIPRLPAGYESCNAMLSERIQPIGQHGRRVLTKAFCPAKIASDMMDNPKNKACLARCYLGKRKQSDRECKFFSLRNFPLYLDYAEALDLPVEGYAVAMARALAFFHWACGIDGNDIEFVLGAARRDSDEDEVIESEKLGPYRLWVLDFDCCRALDFSSDERLVDRIVHSFWRNDPYYPRPGKERESDQRLWKLFSEEYVNSSIGVITRRFEGENERARLLRIARSIVPRLEEGRDITLR